MRLVLISDTHVPRRARDLPSELWRAIDSADAVVHAGDWLSKDLVDQVSARAGLLVGVRGNNDGPDIPLPDVAYAEVAGLRLAVLHDTGPASGRESRMAERFPDTDLLVFGHSHIPWDTTAPNGLRLLNPGSPTDRRQQPYGTWLSVTVRRRRITRLGWHAVIPGSAAAPTSAGRRPGSA